MEFKRTEGSIGSLKNKTSISVDEMLGLINCAVLDCYKINNVKDVTGMDVSDQKQMVLNLNAVASMVLQAARENTSAFNTLTSSINQKITDTLQELNKVNAEYANACSDVNVLIEKNNLLQEKLQELSSINRKYDELNIECSSLQNKIDQLKNVDINGLEKTRDSLKNELNSFNTQRDILLDENSVLSASLADAKSQLNGAQIQHKELKEGIDTAKTEKKALEKNITILEKELSEINKWIQEFPRIHKKMFEESKKHESLIAQLRTSMNCIFSDSFLTENLFCKTGNSQSLTIDNYPDLNVVSAKISSVDDLKTWSDTVMMRIQGLLTVYQEELRRVVDCCNSIPNK